MKDRFGTLQNDGTVASTAAIAVIIAPGATLTRLDTVAQDRSCTGDAAPANCRQTGICSSVTTPLCKAINYLDIAPTSEDNAIYTENNNTGGFISGPILNANGLATLNDVAVALSYDDLMPAVQRTRW